MVLKSDELIMFGPRLPSLGCRRDLFHRLSHPIGLEPLLGGAGASPVRSMKNARKSMKDAEINCQMPEKIMMTVFFHGILSQNMLDSTMKIGGFTKQQKMGFSHQQ
jgi:hypothetical protein